jgi:hypothetical protein
VSFAFGAEPSARIELAWLFGAWRSDLRRPGSASRGRRRAPPARWVLLWRGDHADRLLRLARSLRRAVRVKELCVRARVGLGDPAETGMLMGWAAPLLVVARAVPGMDVRIEPDFVSSVLEGEARGELRACPLLVLPPLLRFALSPGTLRSLRALGRGR